MSYRDGPTPTHVPIGASTPDIDLVASVASETGGYWLKGYILFGALTALMIGVAVKNWNEENGGAGGALCGAVFFTALGLLVHWGARRTDPKRLIPILRADPSVVEHVVKYTTSDSRGIFRTTWLRVVVRGMKPFALKVGTDETAQTVAAALKRLAPNAKFQI